jgi:hypothetical protein
MHAAVPHQQDEENLQVYDEGFAGIGRGLDIDIAIPVEQRMRIELIDRVQDQLWERFF